MGLMDGKKGIIFGVSNKFGIANAIAEQLHAQGAEIAFTYANEAMEKRVRPIAESMNAKMCLECDVTKDEDVKKVFEEYAKIYDRLDFVIHAVAFANKEDLLGDFYTTSKEGWDLAMHVSAYSLLTLTKYGQIKGKEQDITETSSGRYSICMSFPETGSYSVVIHNTSEEAIRFDRLHYQEIYKDAHVS